ncbi:MAG: hypothetical protein GY841_12650 [FCB group bacterium]|nr:hypothetical protein [FCB group bacterium]
MKRATVTILCLIFTVSLALPAWGGGMGIWGVGAKAKGMGGAYRAVANDWSAAYYNPAGLFYVTDNQLTFNEVITNYQAKFSPSVAYGDYKVGFYEGEIYNRYEILTNPTLGGYFKLPVKGTDFVTGLAIFQPYDMNMSWQMFQSLNNSFGLPGQQIEHNFDAVAINWIGAFELMENKLSLGWSVGFLKADLVYGGFFLRPNPIDPEASYYDHVASRPNDLITQWQRSDGEGFAPNLRAGIMFKPTPRFSLGASAALKTTVTVDGDALLYYYMPDIPDFYNVNDIYQDSIFTIMSSGSRYQTETTFETEITLPTQLAAGVAYQVTDKLLVAGDMEYTMWSDFKGYKFEYKFAADPITRSTALDEWFKQNLSVPVNWKNTIKGSVGLEYLHTDVITLRTGYSADQSPVEVGTMNPSFFDPGLKHSFSLGLGLNFENVTLDFATQYIKFDECTESGNVYLESDGQTDDIVDNIAGVYSGSVWESIVQITVRF